MVQMPGRKPAIALLSDHVLFRQVVSQRLAEQGFGPVLELPSTEKLIAAMKKRRLDIAIIDVEHENGALVELVRELRREQPALHVIMLATPLQQSADDSIVLETGGVDRAAALLALIPGLRASTDDKLLQRHWSQITTRQREVMRWLAIGLDNAAIGQKLRIGERAV